jgi:hypothetical protein
MKIDTIFELDGLRCIEPSFAELTEEYFTSVIVSEQADDARLLVDEKEMPIALAVRIEEQWYVANFVFRSPTIEIIEIMEQVGDGIYQESRMSWIAALREYYSTAILREIPACVEDTREGRMNNVRDLLSEIWNGNRPDCCLDCCCGSGVGSAVLRNMGIPSLSFDNDSALLSLGLKSGRLVPDETMLIDATLASLYMENAPAGISLMMGDIKPYTQTMWEQIVDELLGLSQETIMTVATEPEIRLVGEWCSARGRTIEIFENERDPIYDRWVCVARQE